MTQICVLEGSDGSGKTTLARQLCDAYGFAYHHEGPPPDGANPLWYYGGVLDSYRGRHVVIDRLALGERVYGPIYRGRDGLGEEGWRVFTRLVTAVGAVQVLCLPPLEAVLKVWRHEQRNELYRQQGEAKLQETYIRYGFLGHTQDFVYDYTRPDELLRLRKFLETSVTPELSASMVGSPTARYLLVGDQVGGVERGEHGIDLPFFETTGSSAYLTRALDYAGFEEKDIAFINSRDAAGNINTIPRFERTIALGMKALEECTRQKIQAREVPHPQYWRRFHHADVLGYAKLLRACR